MKPENSAETDKKSRAPANPGVVSLPGKSLRERAEAMASIAHPDFRDWLEEEFHRIYRL